MVPTPATPTRPARRAGSTRDRSISRHPASRPVFRDHSRRRSASIPPGWLRASRRSRGALARAVAARHVPASATHSSPARRHDPSRETVTLIASSSRSAAISRRRRGGRGRPPHRTNLARPGGTALSAARGHDSRFPGHCPLSRCCGPARAPRRRSPSGRFQPRQGANAFDGRNSVPAAPMPDSESCERTNIRLPRKNGSAGGAQARRRRDERRSRQRPGLRCAPSHGATRVCGGGRGRPQGPPVHRRPRPRAHQRGRRAAGDSRIPARPGGSLPQASSSATRACPPASSARGTSFAHPRAAAPRGPGGDRPRLSVGGISEFCYTYSSLAD